MRPKKKPEVDWNRVRELRRRSYEARSGGHVLSAEEVALMEAAFKADPERYSQIGKQVKAESWDWLPHNPHRKDAGEE
jgi:hypothetical protein